MTPSQEAEQMKIAEEEFFMCSEMTLLTILKMDWKYNIARNEEITQIVEDSLINKFYVRYSTPKEE